jgi:hypothetical protein
MEARLSHAAILAAALASLGASHRTANFVVRAASKDVAREVAEAAEKYRHDLAVDWLGQPMGNWPEPCPITVEVGPNLGAGGATSFVFDRGRVYGWEMTIQGSRERLIDSVLPHEVTHTIFATYFGRPLPRWADEGASSTVEHESERSKQQRMLVAFLRSERGIPFNRMFAMKQYPRDILPLYAQGHSLATFLMAQGGKRKFLRFVKDGLDGDHWADSMRDNYGFKDLGELQTTWLDWVRRGSPLPLAKRPAKATSTERLVKHDNRQPPPHTDLVYREPAGKLTAAAQQEDRPHAARPASNREASDAPLEWHRPGERAAATTSDLLVMADDADATPFDAAHAPGPIVSQSHRAMPPEPATATIAADSHPAPAAAPKGTLKRSGESVYQKRVRSAPR